MNLSVFGLGKLGASLAGVLAFKGHNVIGVDIDDEIVAKINNGQSPVDEPGLAELIIESKSRLTAMTDGEAAARDSDVSFLIVPTPSEESGNFSLDYILSAAGVIGRAIAGKETYHVVVITSTVVPGATEGQIIPALEKASGKKCGVDFGLCYSPEFVALGNVVADMLAPDIVLIGESDARAGDTLIAIYESVNENTPSVERMNIVNAEVTKLAVNTYVTTKISFANMLSQICELLPGANADIVTSAVGSDSRIGKKYIRPGVAYGGPCFPRDNKALCYLARSVGTSAPLAEATDKFNGGQIQRLKNLVTANLPAGGTVGILGMSYKPGTGVADESAGLRLAQLLVNDGMKPMVFDPMAMPHVESILGNQLTYSKSLADCVANTDLVIVTTPWEDFKNLPLDRDRPLVIIDGWQVVENVMANEKVRYLSLGSGLESA